jgi:CBS-domain-containing membrane protein
VRDEGPDTSDWRRTALFTVEDVESAVGRAGETVYGSDERLDHLVRETRRFLEQRRRRSYGKGDPSLDS